MPYKVNKVRAKRLKEFRLDKGLSQLEMGELVGVNQPTISLWERCHLNISDAMAVRIAKAFKMSVKKFWGE